MKLYKNSRLKKLTKKQAGSEPGARSWEAALRPRLSSQRLHQQVCPALSTRSSLLLGSVCIPASAPTCSCGSLLHSEYQFLSRFPSGSPKNKTKIPIGERVKTQNLKQIYQSTFTIKMIVQSLTGFLYEQKL